MCVNSLIDAEQPPGQTRATFGWESYHDLAEIYAFLDDLLARYPTVLTEHRVGYSHHGTEIRAVKLSHKAVSCNIFFFFFYFEICNENFTG